MRNAGLKDDQISTTKWHQKGNVMAQDQNPIFLVTRSHLDLVWAYLTISMYMVLNKVGLFAFRIRSEDFSLTTTALLVHLF